MVARRSVLRSDAFRVVVAATAAALFGTLVLDRAAAAVGVPMEAATGFGLALGVLFGLRAAVGTGFGYVLTDVVTGAFGLRSAVAYAAAFVLVFLGAAFWNTFDRSDRPNSAVRALGRFLLVAVPATVGGTAVAAWGAELLANAPFAIAFISRLPGSFLGALTVGAGTFLLLRAFVSPGTVVRNRSTGDGPAFASRRIAVAVAVVLISWGMGAALLSVAFQPFQLEYTQILANRFGWTIAAFVGMAGPAGRNLQIVAGLVVISCLIAGIALAGSEYR